MQMLAIKGGRQFIGPLIAGDTQKGVFDLLINYFPQKTGDVTLLSMPRN